MDFVQTMKGWRRMCETIQSENQKTSSGGWCKGCPVQGVCVIDTEIKDTTEKGLAMIGERIQSWAEENPELIYPTWGEWLEQQGICFSSLTHRNHVGGIAIPEVFNYQIEGKTAFICGDKVNEPIPADMAQRLGIEPR